MNSDPGDIQQPSKTSTSDAVLIGLILLLSILSILWIGGVDGGLSAGPKVAEIYRGEKLAEYVDLTRNKRMNLLEKKMQIEIREGKIRVLKSDCPRQICVNMGWIRHPGETIVCVPNKILIEIKSAGEPVVDAVVS